MTRRWMLLAAVLAVVITTGLWADDKDTKQESTWTYTSIVVDGKEMPADEVKEYTVTLGETKYTVKKGNQVIEEGTHKHDTSKTPNWMDRTATSGENKGKTFLGIVEITGETAKVCWGAPGGDRPTEFSSKAGSGHVLATLKRKPQ